MIKKALPLMLLLIGCAAVLLYLADGAALLDRSLTFLHATYEAEDDAAAGDCPIDPVVLEVRRAAAAPDNAASGRFRKAPENLAFLHKQLKSRIEERSFSVKLSLYDFATGGQIKIGAHERFNPASMIKTLLLLTVLKEVDEGRISLHDTHLLSERDKYIGETPVTGAGTLQFAEAGTLHSVEELLALMVSLSDNVATNILFDRLGAKKISDTATTLELKETSFTRKMYDHQSSLPLNAATAFELNRVLIALENAEMFSKELSKKGIRMMLKTADKRIGRYLGDYTEVANKVGTDSSFIGDMALLYFPDRAPVALTVAVVDTANPEEAMAFIGELAALIVEKLLELK